MKKRIVIILFFIFLFVLYSFFKSANPDNIFEEIAFTNKNTFGIKYTQTSYPPEFDHFLDDEELKFWGLTDYFEYRGYPEWTCYCEIRKGMIEFCFQKKINEEYAIQLAFSYEEKTKKLTEILSAICIINDSRFGNYLQYDDLFSLLKKNEERVEDLIQDGEMALQKLLQTWIFYNVYSSFTNTDYGNYEKEEKKYMYKDPETAKIYEYHI